MRVGAVPLIALVCALVLPAVHSTEVAVTPLPARPTRVLRPRAARPQRTPQLKAKGEPHPSVSVDKSGPRPSRLEPHPSVSQDKSGPRPSRFPLQGASASTPSHTPGPRFRTLAPSHNALGAYTGPFTLLSANALDNTADPLDGFGTEDKLVQCNDKLVFVDLNTRGGANADVVITYDTTTSQWTTTPIVSLPCPETGEGGLLPRDGGSYTIGVTASPLGGDRLLVIGGTDGENNVYYSDTCGLVWMCYDANQFWSPREFTTVINAPGVLPGDPLIMGGGYLVINDNGTTVFDGFSVMVALSYDFGIHWQRPECYAAAECSYALTAPDSVGKFSVCHFPPFFLCGPVAAFTFGWASGILCSLSQPPPSHSSRVIIILSHLSFPSFQVTATMQVLLTATPSPTPPPFPAPWVRTQQRCTSSWRGQTWEVTGTCTGSMPPTTRPGGLNSMAGAIWARAAKYSSKGASQELVAGLALTNCRKICGFTGTRACLQHPLSPFPPPRLARGSTL